MVILLRIDPDRWTCLNRFLKSLVIHDFPVSIWFAAVLKENIPHNAPREVHNAPVAFFRTAPDGRVESPTLEEAAEGLLREIPRAITVATAPASNDTQPPVQSKPIHRDGGVPLGRFRHGLSSYSYIGSGARKPGALARNIFALHDQPPQAATGRVAGGSRLILGTAIVVIR